MDGGETIGGYRLQNLLQTGQTSQVYEVVEMASMRHFAMKILLPEHAKLPEQRRSLFYEAEVGKKLVVTLKFGPTRERSIAGLKRVSKPGLRVYARKDNLPRVLGGLGVAILSTSGGLMTDKQANKKGVGGEVLAYVW